MEQLRGNYFNTTGESGDVLEKLNIKANCSTGIILKYFQKNSDKKFTPSEIWNNCFSETKTPLTTIRRAISNLTNKHGLLTKLKDKKEGMYGANEHYWEFKK